MLRIYTFGGLRIEHGGQPLQLSTQKARDLLAYLVTFRDRPHPRSVLAGTLWPNLPEDKARRRLSDTLWRVRRVLGDYVAADKASIWLDPDVSHWLDVEEFETRLQQAGNKEANADPCTLHLTTYIQLYAGPFLDGLYHDWVLLERERLRERWLTLLDQLAHAYREEHPEAAIEAARILLQADPWHEPGTRLLMDLLAKRGRAGEALQVYLDLRTRLQVDLGVAPTAETANLYRRIRAAHPRLPPPTFPSTPQHQPVIRERELAILEAALQSARHNQGQLILLSGPAGIGKTHLAQTVAAKSHQMGFWTLYTSAEEPFGPPALYSPLGQALRLGVETLEDSPSGFSLLGQAALATLLPDLVPASPDLDASHLPPSRFHDALASGLASLADAGPLLLVLDDLHWADPAVWAVLRALLPRLTGCPLALVAAFRSADLPATITPWPGRIAAHPAVRSITLGQISAKETDQLATQLLGQPLPPALTARIHRETGGNPLFIVETMRGLMEAENLCPETEGLSVWLSEEALPIPANLQHAIAARLDHLTPPSRHLLSQAAVLGADFDFDLLWAVSGEKDEGRFLEHLDELLNRNLLIEDGESYDFAHSLVRHVVYDETHPRRRRIWHRRAAEIMARLAPWRIAARARHAHAAQEWSEALELSLEAAEQALALFAIDEAEAFYCLAQEAEGHLDETPETRLRRLRGLAQVYRLRNDEEAEAQVLEEWRVIVHGKDACLESMALARLARNACRRGHSTDGLPLAQEAVLLASTAPGARATALEALGMCQEAQGNLAASLDLHRQAAVAASQAGATQQEAASLNSLAITLENIGEVEEATKVYRRATDLAAACGDRLTESRALNNLGTIHVLQGDYGPARRTYESVLSAVEALEIPEGISLVQGNLAEVWMLMGYLDTARTFLDASLELLSRLDHPGEHARALTNLAGLAVAAGKAQEALSLLRQAQQLLPEQGLLESHLYYHFQAATAYLALGDVTAAAGHATQLAQQAQQAGLGWLEGQIATLDGKVKAAQGDLEGAERSLRRAVQLCESQGFRADVANARAELGLILQRAGQGDEAARALAAAWEELARRMLRLDLARLLDRLGHPPILPGQQEADLPRIDAPLRRQPTAEEITTILWTPNAGALEPSLRRQHLRRARLRRLITEAAVQGAAPTIEHLAQAVGVSTATLNTDLRALRKEGWPAFTRGYLEPFQKLDNK